MFHSLIIHVTWINIKYCLPLTQSVKWDVARRSCLDVGMDLPTTESEYELKTLVAVVKSAASSCKSFFIPIRS